MDSHVVQLNEFFRLNQTKNDLNNALQLNKELKLEGQMELLQSPFTCCVLRNFIKNNKFLKDLQEDLQHQIFIEKNNDLYKFRQTDDFKHLPTKAICTFRKFMQEDVLPWFREVTKIPLTDDIDITCSKYDYTDTLLCHDDELEGRRIAFILYLVPPWEKEDGGLLNLFDMDENGQPKDVCHFLVPEWNSFAWFEVTPASHHEVSEVLSSSKSRLSINGWFHGPSVPREKAYIETSLPLQTYGQIEEDMMYEWINETYLNPLILGDIQERFEHDSEIELQNFLKIEKYEAIIKTLQSEVKWCKKGPPNKRNYFYAKEEDMPQILKDCLKLFKSEVMFLTLSNFTGLKLHPLAPNDSSDSEDSETGSYSELASDSRPGCSSTSSSKVRSTKPSEERSSEHDSLGMPSEKKRRLNSVNEQEKVPKCRGEVRKWEHGCYTLVHDTDSEGVEFALDAILFFSCEGWQQDFGGSVSYIAASEDEELLTVNPAANSLALVYRDKETLKFVKHINKNIEELSEKQYFDLSMTYFE